MAPEGEPVLALVTCPGEDADRLARDLVGSRLAACVNTVPAIGSVYRWEGAVEVAEESLLVIKTLRQQIPAIEQRLETVHPYENFELIATEIVDGAAPYLAWIAEEADPGRGSITN